LRKNKQHPTLIALTSTRGAAERHRTSPS
jgi:hypothetical protein